MISRIVAIVIFVIMFVEIVREKRPRFLVALVAGAATIVVVFLVCMHSIESVRVALSFDSMLEPTFWYAGHEESSAMNTGINWSTIIFIAGMMIMVEGMSEAGFFDWLCLRLAKAVNYKPVPLFICFMVLSAVLSMFIDSITVILFLAVASVRLGHLLEFDPVPFIIAQIFTANLGGSATMSGDPPNIIIGTALGYSFFDFLRNTGVIALVGLIVVVPFFYFCFRKELVSEADMASLTAKGLDPRGAITSMKKFAVSVVIFAFVVLLLITHAMTGLTVATVGVIAAVITLATNRAPLHLIKRVDWETILFFIGLFVAVSGLEETGVLEALANGIAAITGGNLTVMVIIIVWLSAIASAFVDNIPFAATMVPVINSLSATMGVPLDTLAWTLAMGTDIGGSATPIGASANVAGTSIAARDGHPITWGRYCKYSAPASILIIALSMVMILLRY
ncbi:SLC13 family permease [Evtepia sp.]|uniref:SLC13 family permease n=1 Tax=Evtepia sp. TaxID=2773933 RepID=UPI003F15ECFA